MNPEGYSTSFSRVQVPTTFKSSTTAMEQTLVRESDAGTPEQLPIKTTYSQGQHKKQMDEIFSSNKLKLSTPFTANIE